MKLPQLDAVGSAIRILAGRLSTVGSETVTVEQLHGRVLAEPLIADRDSPACDVSAMDGYAGRLSDLAHAGTLPVQATAAAGNPPLVLIPGQVIRIFTGAAIPSGAECVLRREDTREAGASIIPLAPAGSLCEAQHIRRQGENIRRGEGIFEAGKMIDAVAIAAVASFAKRMVGVRRKVRVAILNTGDELFEPGSNIADWQIRDSNGPTLHGWLSSLNWVQLLTRRQVSDRFASVRDAIDQALLQCDAVLLTGGVSMGDTDFVPAAIEELGGEIIFHRLPIRPGKPVLGATLAGKLILGLPGNPVSVAITSRVLGLPLLESLSGCLPTTRPPRVQLDAPDEKQLNLTWYRLIQIDSVGRVTLTPSQGSGDLVSLARSDGFIEVPPGQSGTGPWKLTQW